MPSIQHPRVALALALGAIALVGATTRAAHAQAAPPRFVLPTRAAGVAVSRDVPYAVFDSGRLAMDVYRPVTSRSARLPAIVFFNRATGAERSDPFYAGWARAAAARGLVAILPDLRDGEE
jgi:hypothetical protein